jgi:hypothetical protein
MHAADTAGQWMIAIAKSSASPSTIRMAVVGYLLDKYLSYVLYLLFVW